MTHETALAAAVLERYRVLRRARTLSRQTPDSPRVTSVDAEIRSLVRLLWHARRVARRHTSDQLYHELGYHGAQAA